jgi:hypothetical protein
MTLSNPTQAGLWEAFETFGASGRGNSALGWNRYAARTSRGYSLAADLARTQAIAIVADSGVRGPAKAADPAANVARVVGRALAAFHKGASKVAAKAARKAERARAKALAERGLALDGSALPGWRLVAPGIASWVG